MAPEATEPPDAEVHAAPDLAVPLRAGPLRLVFDRGELRWIRLGEREVLRGIYVAVREEGWATVPAALEDLEIEAEPESFRVRFRTRHRRGDVAFDWEGRIEGSADGRITFAMDGRALSALFLKDRIREEFAAIISGVSTFGMFIELLDSFISGAVPLGDLADDYYILDTRAHRLIGERTGRTFQMGDLIRVKLVHVDMLSKKITFAPLQATE